MTMRCYAKFMRICLYESLTPTKHRAVQTFNGRAYSRETRVLTLRQRLTSIPSYS